MTAAIGFLHSQRIIYKDLKCDNLLMWSTNIDDSVNVKISDYGLSRYYTPQGLTGSEGTPGYQAPEMMSNAPYNEKVNCSDCRKSRTPLSDRQKNDTSCKSVFFFISIFSHFYVSIFRTSRLRAASGQPGLVTLLRIIGFL